MARDLGDGQTAIAGFLLLRAVVPTIVTPSLYDPSITIPKEIKEGFFIIIFIYLFIFILLFFNFIF